MFLKKQLIVVKACTPVSEILHLSYFCHSFCSAKCRWRKEAREDVSSSFFFLTIFLTSFVFLPPRNVNSAQHLICFFSHSISFSGVEKAHFRSFFLFVWVTFFFFFGLFVCFVKKMVHWLVGIQSLAIAHYVSTDLFLQGRDFERKLKTCLKVEIYPTLKLSPLRWNFTLLSFLPLTQAAAWRGNSSMNSQVLLAKTMSRRSVFPLHCSSKGKDLWILK